MVLGLERKMKIEVRTDDGEVLRLIHISDNEPDYHQLSQQVDFWINQFRTVSRDWGWKDIDWDL